MGDIAALLGGPAILRHTLSRSIDAHDLLLDGLPVRAFGALLDNLRVLNFQNTASLDRAVGMSLRTFQRHREQSTKTLSQEQSGKAWKFAETLARATAVFGSQEEAETWLDRPALGGDQRAAVADERAEALDHRIPSCFRSSTGSKKEQLPTATSCSRRTPTARSTTSC